MSPHANESALAFVGKSLGPLASEIVFVGGATVSLLITDAAAPPIRISDDVDGVVAVDSIAGYYSLSARLRKLGFREDDSEGAPRCRWKIGAISVDIMSPAEAVMGFTNRWYAETVAHSETRSVQGVELRIATAPYFLATKLEAFDGRGQGDFRGSRDVEDIVAVVDGRAELIEEVRAAKRDLRRYLSIRLRRLLRNPRFTEAVSGHLTPDEASQQRLPIVLERVRAIAALK